MTSDQAGRAPRATMTPSIDRLVLACVHATQDFVMEATVYP
jgi:hypothetical protein